MDAPRIVIGLADDRANELARHEKHDTASVDDITTPCSGWERLNLFNDADYQGVQPNHLVDSDLRSDDPAYYDEKIGLAHGTTFDQQQSARRAGFHDQPYLTAAGINLPAMRGGADAARWARYEGAGVQFIQIEEGWNVMHDGVRSPRSKGIPRNGLHHRPDAPRQRWPGNRSRERRGVEDSWDCASVHVEGPVRAQVRGGAATRTIGESDRLAARNLAAGDVILLALQVEDTLLPVEVKPGVFKAIRAATSKGIIVIEAAGNQGRPLEDALEHPRRAAAWQIQRTTFRASRDCRIPARSSWAAARSRPIAPSTMSLFRMTTRAAVHVSIAARGVEMSGHPMASLRTTASSTGRVAAAPAIAGLALILQQRAKERLGRPLTPLEMRALFRDPTCGH
jgi:hypothetical protein